MRTDSETIRKKIKSLRYWALPWDTENKLLLKFRADVETLHIVYSHVRALAAEGAPASCSCPHHLLINQIRMRMRDQSVRCKFPETAFHLFPQQKRMSNCKTLFPLLFLSPPLGFCEWRLSVYRFNLHWAFALFPWLFLQCRHSESDCWLLCLGISSKAAATRSTDTSYAPANYCATSSVRPLKLHLLIPQFCMPNTDKASEAAPKYPPSLQI